MSHEQIISGHVMQSLTTRVYVVLVTHADSTVVGSACNWLPPSNFAAALAYKNRREAESNVKAHIVAVDLPANESGGVSNDR